MSPIWNRYYSAADELRIPIYLYQQDLHTLKKVRDIISRVCKGDCRIAGQRVVYLEYGEKITRTMIESFALSITLVVGILLCILSVNDKIRYFFPVTISALLGPLVTLTLMAVFQIPVTLVTSIILAVMVGLAVSNFDVFKKF
jgi:predicted RND superfamily exporter protein